MEREDQNLHVVAEGIVRDVLKIRCFQSRLVGQGAANVVQVMVTLFLPLVVLRFLVNR